MTEVLEYLHEFNFVSVMVRLLLALAAGGIIGYGRTRRRRNAGLRTYILVSIGAAMTMILSLYEHEMLQSLWRTNQEVKFDASRFSAQVIAGIGFLASGTIIAVGRQEVTGLTTAISLFAAGCLGIAAGAGFYECVILAGVLMVLTLEVLQPMEKSFKRRLHNVTIYVEYTDALNVSEITEAVTGLGAQILEMDIETKTRAEQNPTAVLLLKLSRENPSHAAVISSVAELACVRSVHEMTT